jgi:hypothetical protein
VGLPWLESHQYLKENKELSKKRCISTTCSPVKEGLFEEYNTVLQKCLNVEVIKRVPEQECGTLEITCCREEIAMKIQPLK